MKVRAMFEFNETVLRGIRARDGRGGKATRKEAKAWVDLLLRVGTTGLPAPKVRAPKAKDISRRLEPTLVDTPEAARAQRNRIAKHYGHATA